MAKKISFSCVLILGAAVLSACAGGSAREKLGLKQSTPDEFRVVSNLPLSVPPDFRLPDPEPGAKRPQQEDIDKQARDLVLGNGGSEQPVARTSIVRTEALPSNAEEAFLKQAGSGSANTSIRQILDDEEMKETRQEEEDDIWDKFVAYTKGEKKQDDTIVNAKKERERIKDASEKEEPITGEGAEEIKKRDRGIFDWFHF